MSIDIERVEQMDSLEFAAWAGALSDSEIRALTPQERERLLAFIFGAIPDSFQPDRAAGGSARLDFIITGAEDPDRYAVVVADGTCRTEKDPDESASASLTLGLVEFLRLIVGRSNPVTMVMFGKIKVAGELSHVLAFQRWFDLPRV